ncbi:hypothetical protein [Curtobacterium sp. MCBA15_004]|uniref:hypothetical protein n=1 Tax=Curtobacterium sp. MCBA15_004 TaxID=1898733 RepID=UPI0008DDA619|nr:hypothetical protein [Curtobacterium sp. MCBA15_004]WIA96449.1 hypothetical protein QOL16_15325 [Curtobacterium sp. MCBA15_004]
MSPAARRHDVETSHDAAASVYEPTEVQQRILDILKPADFFARSRGMTDQEIVAEYQSRGGVIPTEQSIRSRRAELVRRGDVVWTGEKKKMQGTRREARLWKAVR